MASIVFDLPALLPHDLKQIIRDLHAEGRITAAKTASGSLVLSFSEVPQSLLTMSLEASAKCFWVRGPRVLDASKPIDGYELNEVLAFPIIPPLGGWQKIINNHHNEKPIPSSKPLTDIWLMIAFPEKYKPKTNDGLGDVLP